ncbi:MAG: AraC family transcriptional regulator [Defluviitaleaceae bacterium]|nr:AraC family transcriptional regulator [Defluviitaleaceae bacterium]
MLTEFLKGRSVLAKYIINAILLLAIFSTAFIVSNVILLNNLNRSYKARTVVSVDGAANFLEDRLHLFVTHAINISRDNTLGYLVLHRETVNYNFISRAGGLIDYLWGIVATHNELSDILVFHDGLDIFFNSISTMNIDMLPHWEETGRFGIDFNLLRGDVRSGFFITGEYVVYYNNYQQGIHVYMLLSRPVLEEMLSRFVPGHYGVFTAYTQQGTLLLQSTSLKNTRLAPDIIIYGSGLFMYHFRHNPSAYSNIIGTMTTMTIGIAIMLVSLSVFLLYRIKKGLYDPIGGILQLTNAQWQSSSQDEFSAIQEGIGIMRKNLAKIEDSQRHIVFNQVVTTEDEEALYALTDLQSRCFCAITILFEDVHGNKDAMRTKAFARATQEHGGYPIYSISKYSTFFFFPKDEAEYSGLITWAEGYLHDGFGQSGVSALYSKQEDIRIALEESIEVFYEQPTQGLKLIQKVVTPTTASTIANSKITAAHHFKLISDAFSGDADKIKNNLIEILAENEEVNAMAKRQLMLCLYDTLCMLGTCKGNTAEHLAMENIYNLQILFDKICENLSPQPQANDDSKDILKWVEENQSRDISLSDLAQHMGMSYNYTGLMFKSKTGMGFAEYLQKRRVEQSMRLLCETDMSIEEITEKVGLVSAATFFRVFKKIAGVTPNTYREAAKQNK